MWLRIKFTTANVKGSSNMWLPNGDFSGMHTELEARGTYRNRDTYTQNILEMLVHTVHILTIAFFSSSQIYRQADLVYCDIVPQNMQNIFCACFFSRCWFLCAEYVIVCFRNQCNYLFVLIHFSNSWIFIVNRLFLSSFPLMIMMFLLLLSALLPAVVRLYIMNIQAVPYQKITQNDCKPHCRAFFFSTFFSLLLLVWWWCVCVSVCVFVCECHLLP